MPYLMNLNSNDYLHTYFLCFVKFVFIYSFKMAKELRTLGWDYLMFVLFIAFTVFTPLWKRLFGKKKQHSKADYVFATGGVSIIAVMISIARGTLGVRTVLGKFYFYYYFFSCRIMCK